MLALVRYQAALLARSHRWVFPLIAYVVLIVAAGGGHGGQSLAGGLDWSAAILVPVTALLTRSMLTAEPAAARACAAAAAGPVRAQLAILVTALAGGVVLALAGAGYELLAAGHQGALAPALGPGLAAAAVCLLTGSAAGTLFNPPLVRHQAAALLATIAAVVLAWASDISPASAALHGAGAAAASAAWPAGVPLAAAAVLAAASWAASCWSARRLG